ncbi:hypothetical protein D3C71_1452150 [compost metagenome]
MLQIAAALPPDVVGDEHEVIALGFRRPLEAVENAIKERMPDAHSGKFIEQNTDGPGFLGHQRPRVGIGQIPHFLRGVQNFVLGLLAHIAIVVEHLGDGSR